MSLAADSILFHRRLRRSLTLWRVLAVLAIICAAAALAAASQSSKGGFAKRSNHIARVDISGLITGDDQTLKLLKKLGETSQVKAIIVRIDSPGGTTAGSEAIYLALRKLAEKKPVASVMDTIAASGGYITALGTDHIVARGNTITGSIGVIFQWAEVRELMTKLGVKMEEIKSGDLKAEPNMFNPLSEKARAVTEAMVQESFRWFTGLVVERRGLNPQQIAAVSDGRVFTGRQAVTARLVDEIGGEEQAVSWFESKKGVAKGLEILDWEPEKSGSGTGLGFSLAVGALRTVGLEAVADFLQKSFGAERVRLDGLMSVWQPEPQLGR
ncbi:MAG: signal peptide peptidase SppA [Parvibaculaceae bacterium]